MRQLLSHSTRIAKMLFFLKCIFFLFDPEDKEAGFRVEKNESFVKLGRHLQRCYDEKKCVAFTEVKKRKGNTGTPALKKLV